MQSSLLPVSVFIRVHSFCAESTHFDFFFFVALNLIRQVLKALQPPREGDNIRVAVGVLTSRFHFDLRSLSAFLHSSNFS